MNVPRAFCAVIALVGADAGCSRAGTGTTYSAEAVVYGTVFDGTGVPVAGATIQTKGYRLSCEGGIQDGDGSPTLVITNPDGFYRQRVIGSAPIEYCLVVGVAPPSGSGLHAGTGTGRVVFTPRANPPYDSVRVDVTLR